MVTTVKDTQLKALKDVGAFLKNTDQNNPQLASTIWKYINDNNIQTVVSQAESNDYSENWSQELVGKLQRIFVNYQLRQLNLGNPSPVFFKLKEALDVLLDENLSLSLIDIGCTSGYYYDVINFYFSNKFYYTGCDYNKESIELAKEYYPTINFQVEDITELSFKDREFEVSLLAGVIEHVPQYKKGLKELCRITDKYIVLHRIWLTDDETICKKGTQYFVPVIRNMYNKEDFFHILKENSFTVKWSGDVYDQNCRTYILERTTE